MTRKHINNRMQEMFNNFGVKYGNQENITKKKQMVRKMVDDLKGLKEGPKAEIHIDLLRRILKSI